VSISPLLLFSWRGWIGKCLSIVAAIAAIIQLAGCVGMGPSEEQGGSGSEIVGKAEYPDSGALCKSGGLPLPRAVSIPVIRGMIFCYTRSFVPDTSWVSAGALPRAYTDNLGIFHLLDVPRGEVVVEAADGNGMSIVKTININRDSSLFDIGTLTVAPAGGISIQAHTQLSGKVRFYVSVEGTHSIARGSAADIDVVLKNIPTGIPHSINIRVYEPIQWGKDISNITVPSGAIRVLEAFEIQ
jgi:hypothetical protein